MFLMIMTTGMSLSQSTVNPDTVCYQSTGLSTYSVPNIGSGTYTWTITAPGVITSGQGTNAISVNWSTAVPGLITNGVTVTYTSPPPANCPATPVTLNVLIYNVTPTINNDNVIQPNIIQKEQPKIVSEPIIENVVITDILKG